MAIKHDLRKYIELLVQKEAAISEIYLFGSRAYGTGSLRSDCDLIVRSDPNKPTKLSALRTFAVESCTALDFFLCTEALFVIFVADGIALDEPKWESDFSFETHRPFVRTVVVRLPQKTL